MYYYTNQLIQAKLIDKDGIIWKLTQLGEFILKELLSRGSVNDNNTSHKLIPVRIHNVTFSFAILPLDENIRDLQL
jgi:hypothetical protein